MKERITFFHLPADDVDLRAVEVQSAGLLGPVIHNMRQDQLIISRQEIPANISNILDSVSSLHVRWASPKQQNTTSPFSSRISPGLHLSYVPGNGVDEAGPQLCELVQQAFGPVRCTSEQSFTDFIPLQNGASTSRYYYEQLETLNDFVIYFSANFCDELDSLCRSRARGLYTAASLDISYDAQTQTAKLSALWPLREQSLVAPASTRRRTEVGILILDPASRKEGRELTASGTVTVLKEQSEPSAIRFAFPSRHRASNVSFSSRFLTPTGLHPTLQLDIDSNEPPLKDRNCRLYTYLTLPKTIFADRYQLADKLFLASKGLKASPYTSSPVDLEAPAYTTSTWGSNVLLELAPPAPHTHPDAWTAQIPLHLRYMRPTMTGYQKTNIPYPVVFWTCASEPAAVDFAESPFDRARMGYDQLFDDGTVFWHARPRGQPDERIVNVISVPVLDENASKWVRSGTTAAILIGFAWILWKLFGVYRQPTKQKTVTRKMSSEEKKTR